MQNSASSTDNSASSTDNSASSTDNSASSTDNSASSTDNSATSKKKRYKPAVLKSIIIDFCAEWKTVEEIMQATGKSKSYLRNSVLPQMMNVLERMYENIPNHPRQKYKAKTT